MMCVDCPRFCRVDRNGGGLGYCGGGRNAHIAKIYKDFSFEEPCLGNVTAVFFSGCSLRCTYCQNVDISRGTAIGREYPDVELSALLENSDRPVDLVTPDHYLSAVERAVNLCKRKPSVIYNTSSFATAEAVDRAARFTDVFLADYKYADNRLAARFSFADGYREIALAAIKRMRALNKDEWADECGRRTLKRGLIIRHLVLPGCVENSLAALDDIARTVGTDVVLSLMSQFTPNGIGEPSARLRKIEYKIVVEKAVKLGFTQGYIQEFDSADSKYTPDFKSER